MMTLNASGADTTPDPIHRVINAIRRRGNLVARGKEAGMVFGWFSRASPARADHV